MKKLEAKKPRALNVPPAVKKRPSKPAKSKLSKSDPDYFKKIGQMSVKKRRLTSAQYSEMARLSHLKPGKGRYNGGRKPKVNDE